MILLFTLKTECEHNCKDIGKKSPMELPFTCSKACSTAKPFICKLVYSHADFGNLYMNKSNLHMKGIVLGLGMLLVDLLCFHLISAP